MNSSLWGNHTIGESKTTFDLLFNDFDATSDQVLNIFCAWLSSPLFLVKYH